MTKEDGVALDMEPSLDDDDELISQKYNKYDYDEHGRLDPLEPNSLEFYQRQNRPTMNPWDQEKFKKDKPELPPWKDNGIDVMLQPVKHMKHDYKHNLFFFGPITEWKENISGEYLFKPKAFKVKEGEEPSLKGHYNSKNQSLYPKLIKSMNKAKEMTLQKFAQKVSRSEEVDVDDIMTREGKTLYIYDWTGTGADRNKRPLKLYHYGPVVTVLFLVLFHKKEGDKLTDFTLNKGDQPMLTLGWNPRQAKQWYDEHGK